MALIDFGSSSSFSSSSSAGSLVMNSKPLLSEASPKEPKESEAVFNIPFKGLDPQDEGVLKFKIAVCISGVSGLSESPKSSAKHHYVWIKNPRNDSSCCVKTQELARVLAERESLIKEEAEKFYLNEIQNVYQEGPSALDIYLETLEPARRAALRIKKLIMTHFSFILPNSEIHTLCHQIERENKKGKIEQIFKLTKVKVDVIIQFLKEQVCIFFPQEKRFDEGVFKSQFKEIGYVGPKMYARGELRKDYIILN